MNVEWICDPNQTPPFGPATNNICFTNSNCEGTIKIPTPYACTDASKYKTNENETSNIKISRLLK